MRADFARKTDVVVFPDPGEYTVQQVIRDDIQQIAGSASDETPLEPDWGSWVIALPLEIRQLLNTFVPLWTDLRSLWSTHIWLHITLYPPLCTRNEPFETDNQHQNSDNDAELANLFDIPLEELFGTFEETSKEA